MAPPSQVFLTFIGGGVLATSIIDGLLEDTESRKEQNVQYEISITTRRDDHVTKLQERYPRMLVTTNNRDRRLWAKQSSVKSYNAKDAQYHANPVQRVVLICTQPQFTLSVCKDMSFVLNEWLFETSPIFVTRCPGITVKQLENWMNRQVPIVRTMPNTPVSVREGTTAMFANARTAQKDVLRVMALFRPISPYVCLLSREEQIDVAASISGSSPAYFFTLMEMLVQAAVARGFSYEMASKLVKQSALGSASLAQSTEAPLNVLVKDVCVPGGSTEKAIRCLHERDLRQMVDDAVACSLLANRAMGAEGGQQ